MIVVKQLLFRNIVRYNFFAYYRSIADLCCMVHSYRLAVHESMKGLVVVLIHIHVAGCCTCVPLSWPGSYKHLSAGCMCGIASQ